VFSGLVEARVPVVRLRRSRSGARLVLAAPRLERGQAPWRPVLGESIAVSGCCLTVVERRKGVTSYDLSSETLERTWLGALEPGRVVNLERSLRLGERLGGHLVSGHVDGLGRVHAIEDVGDGGRLFEFEAPRGFERWLISKGSVTVDGVSLTVVAPRARRFRVALIPETLRRTSLGLARAGDPVHLEGDAIGKWLDHLLEQRGPAARSRRRARS